jgi:putative photosynthetic complex assembly protein
MMEDASHPHVHNVGVPRGALIGGAIVIAFSIAMAGAARLSGYGRSTTRVAAPVESRTLLFDDRKDGAVVVRDAKSDAVVAEIAPGSYGFVRVAMRGMARDRKLREIGPATPFVLTRWSDHRVTIDDPETGRRLDLAAFGRPNAEAFERLLESGAGGSK